MSNYFNDFGLVVPNIEKVALPAFVDGKPLGNISERLISYIIATQAKKAFARLIVENDKKLEYHAESISIEKDPEAVKKALTEYQKEKNEVERLINQWKEENKDLFMKIPYVPNVSIYASGFELKGQYTVEEAIQGYKLSGALSNFIKKDKSEIQTSSKTVIIPEFKDQYDSVRHTIITSVGLPSEAEITSSVTEEVKVKKTRLKLNRAPYSDTAPFYKYASEYTDYLINLDAQSLISKSKEETEENDNE